jgi:hypothetical protein
MLHVQYVSFGTIKIARPARSSLDREVREPLAPGRDVLS